MGNESETDPLEGRPREMLAEMLEWDNLETLGTVAGALLFGVLEKSGRSLLEMGGQTRDGDPVFCTVGHGPAATTLERATAGIRVQLEGQAENSATGAGTPLADQPQDRVEAYMKLLGLCLRGVMPDGPAVDGRAQFCVMVWDQPGVVHFDSNVTDKAALAAAMVRASHGLYEPTSIINHD